MQTYNAIVRLGGELHNEVSKNNLTAPEILVLRKVHGQDAVVKIEPSGEWEDHFGEVNVRDDVTGEYHKEEREYDDDVEKNRLADTYGSAIVKDEDGGDPRAAIDRMFGEFAPLPAELPEYKKARKAQAAEEAKAKPATSKKGNFDKVA